MITYSSFTDCILISYRCIIINILFQMCMYNSSRYISIYQLTYDTSNLTNETSFIVKMNLLIIISLIRDTLLLISIFKINNYVLLHNVSLNFSWKCWNTFKTSKFPKYYKACYFKTTKFCSQQYFHKVKLLCTLESSERT